jgi:hypothetical protein
MVVSLLKGKGSIGDPDDFSEILLSDHDIYHPYQLMQWV